MTFAVGRAPRLPRLHEHMNMRCPDCVVVFSSVGAGTTQEHPSVSYVDPSVAARMERGPFVPAMLREDAGA